MASSESVETLTIAKWERLRVSHMGNPRFRVTFTNGRVAETKKDAAVNYGLENPEYNEGRPINVTFDSEGKIIYVEEIK